MVRAEENGDANGGYASVGSSMVTASQTTPLAETMPPANATRRKEVGTCPDGVGGVTKLGTTGAQTCRNFPFGNRKKWLNPGINKALTQETQTESFPFLPPRGSGGRPLRRGTMPAIQESVT